MSFKTLAYVLIALVLSAGLLVAAWQMSGSLLRVEQDAPSQVPQPGGQVAPANTGDAGNSQPDRAQQPETETAPKAGNEPAAKATGQDGGYYEDGSKAPVTRGTGSESGSDRGYAPQGSQDGSEILPQQFPSDDREIDRPKPGEEPAKPSEPQDTDGADPYAPDPQDFN